METAFFIRSITGCGIGRINGLAKDCTSVIEPGNQGEWAAADLLQVLGDWWAGVDSNKDTDYETVALAT